MTSSAVQTAPSLPNGAGASQPSPPIVSDLPHASTSSASPALSDGPWQPSVRITGPVHAPPIPDPPGNSVIPQRVTMPTGFQPSAVPVVSKSQPSPSYHSYPPPPSPSAAPPLYEHLYHHHPAQVSHAASAAAAAPAPAPSKPRTRPPIMDPPGTQIPTAALHANGFPSPTLDHAASNTKFLDDVARITYAVHQSLPKAVRRVVRDNWEKCLLGTDFHQAFVLNASIHHATNSMTKRSIRDFGHKMIRTSKHELIEHFTPADIDDVANDILGKASMTFLDKALDLRLKTIAAKPLIAALARAERLGYDPNDIVEDDRESIIPVPTNSSQLTVSASASASASPAARHPSTPSGIPAPNPHAKRQCQLCYRTFVAETAYIHHTEKQVCTRTPTTAEGFQHACSHCGQGFSTLVGLQYHLNNKVCGDFGETPAGIAAAARAGGSAKASMSEVTRALGSVAPASVAPSVVMGMGTLVPKRSGPPVTKPPPAERSTPESSHVTSHGDPYAHLTNTQKISLNEELRQAEIQFAERFKAADGIPDAAERRVRIEGLRNSFGTKQSNIRKKYGVRLRERRTKAEIEAERARMGRSAHTFNEVASGPQRRQQPSSAMSSAPRMTTVHPPVRPGGPAAATTVPVKREVIELDDSMDEDDANDPKRRKLDGNNNTYQSPYTSAKQEGSSSSTVPAGVARQASSGAVSGLGITSSQGPPSAQPPASQPATPCEQAGVRVSIHQPSTNGTADATSGRSSVETIDNPAATAPAAAAAGTRAAEEEQEDDDDDDEDDDDDDDDSSDDEDIPAVLPASVQQSFAPANRPSLSR